MTARWIFRTDDDSVVNWRLLPTVISELEQKGDPLTEYISMGNCLHQADNVFPHGGAGWIISRRLAEVMVARAYQDAMRNALADDYGIGRFWGLIGRNVGWTARQWTSPRFLGLGYMGRGAATVNPTLHNIEAVWHRNWTALPRCPPLSAMPARACAPFLSPRNDLFVYHPFKSAWRMRAFAKWVFRAGCPALRYWVDGSQQSVICWNGTNEECQRWRSERVEMEPFWKGGSK
jgi:hypothetical protein